MTVRSREMVDGRDTNPSQISDWPAVLHLQAHLVIRYGVWQGLGAAVVLGVISEAVA